MKARHSLMAALVCVGAGALMASPTGAAAADGPAFGYDLVGPPAADAAVLPDVRDSARGVPVVNRLDDDGVYGTWSVILRHENGRATLAYESGGNLDLLRRAHAAVEEARLLKRAVTVEGLSGLHGWILADRLTIAADERPARVFETDAGDALEDAAIEAEAAEAAQPDLALVAVNATIADLALRDGAMVRVVGVPVAGAFKHQNGQGILNALVEEDGRTVLAYESGENIDQLSRIAALIDLAGLDRSAVAFVGRYDGERQVIELSAIETADGERYLTDLGEAGAAAGPGLRRGPIVERAVEVLIDRPQGLGLYGQPWPGPALEEEYLSPVYVETPVPVVIEREVIVERHVYWVFPEIVICAYRPEWGGFRPRWLHGWRPWSFCPAGHFDLRWRQWHVQRHPAFFEFHAFSWRRDRDDRRDGNRFDGRRDGRSDDHHRRSDSDHGPSRPAGREPSSRPRVAGSRRDEVHNRAEALAGARRRVLDNRPGEPQRHPRPTIAAADRPSRPVIVRATEPPPRVETIRRDERPGSTDRRVSIRAPIAAPSRPSVFESSREQSLRSPRTGEETPRRVTVTLPRIREPSTPSLGARITRPETGGIRAVAVPSAARRTPTTVRRAAPAEPSRIEAIRDRLTDPRIRTSAPPTRAAVPRTAPAEPSRIEAIRDHLTDPRIRTSAPTAPAAIRSGTTRARTPAVSRTDDRRIGRATPSRPTPTPRAAASTPPRVSAASRSTARPTAALSRSTARRTPTLPRSTARTTPTPSRSRSGREDDRRARPRQEGKRGSR